MPDPAPYLYQLSGGQNARQGPDPALDSGKTIWCGRVLDERSIEPGETWREELKDAVEECDVLLPLIHADWHKDQDDESGEKSLNQPHDWIRQEIATALKAK